MSLWGRPVRGASGTGFVVVVVGATVVVVAMDVEVVGARIAARWWLEQPPRTTTAVVPAASAPNFDLIVYLPVVDVTARAEPLSVPATAAAPGRPRPPLS